MKTYALAATIIGFSLPAFAQSAPTPPPIPSPIKPAPVPMPAEVAKPAAPLDIQAQVSKAITEYQRKNYGKAAEALDAASEQMRQMKSDTLAQFLPAAPKGWTAKPERDRFLMHIAYLPANGSTVEREYSSGGEDVKISIAADSKITGAMRKLMNNGSQPMQLMGYDYTFRSADANVPEMVRRNEAALYVDDNLTVTISGKQLTDQQAQGFLGMIDLAKLKTAADK